MFCNVCVLVFFASFQLWTQAMAGLDFNTVLRNPNERCLTEAGLKWEDLLRYMENPSFSDFFEGNRTCYVFCVGKELGKLTNDGKIDLVAAAKDAGNIFYKAALLPLLTTCAKENGANPCETTKKNLECVLKEVQKLPFKVGSLMPWNRATAY